MNILAVRVCTPLSMGARKTGKTFTGTVGGIRTFNDSKLIQDDMGTVWVVIPPGKFEWVYN